MSKDAGFFERGVIIRLTLKSGKKVEGYVVEAESGKDCIKVSVQGIPLTYCADQIKAIEMNYDKPNQYIRIDVKDASQGSYNIRMPEGEKTAKDFWDKEEQLQPTEPIE